MGFVDVALVQGRRGGGLNIVRSGLVSWWDFLAGFGSLVLGDVHGANNGTITNTTVGAFWAQGSRRGVFDEVDDHVVIGNPANLQITGDLTIEAWVWLVDLTGNKGVVGKNATNEIQYEFMVTTDELQFRCSTDGTTNLLRTTTDANFLAETWYHVAVVFDASASDATFYRDLTELTDNGGALTTSLHDGSANVHVGRGTNTGRYFGGRLGAVRVYSRVLTLAELTQNRGEELPFYS